MSIDPMQLSPCMSTEPTQGLVSAQHNLRALPCPALHAVLCYICSICALCPCGSMSVSRACVFGRRVCMQATFMFSGIWHILVFWYNTRVISARWAMFFIIQVRTAQLPRFLFPHMKVAACTYTVCFVRAVYGVARDKACTHMPQRRNRRQRQVNVS